MNNSEFLLEHGPVVEKEGGTRFHIEFIDNLNSTAGNGILGRDLLVGGKLSYQGLCTKLNDHLTCNLKDMPRVSDKNKAGERALAVQLSSANLAFYKKEPNQLELAAEHRFHMDPVSQSLLQGLIYLVSAASSKEKALQDVNTDDKVTKVVMKAVGMHIKLKGFFTHPTVSAHIFCFCVLSVE
jgi:hypothetical protein